MYPVTININMSYMYEFNHIEKRANPAGKSERTMALIYNYNTQETLTSKSTTPHLRRIGAY